ncbi:unnamed protein product [Paramecium pentaurelia]|uniref:RING-type domain-containing protein n=1 Tax=Paramecium pentaurelia TaxID=43138 RepID=A0A8S1VV27_9CILI|nr:unnamed protein product [Paramecium pentaurelia]
MSEFFQKITNFCRGKETKENDSDNEDQEIQKQPQIQIGDKFIQSNNSPSNSENLQSTNSDVQENQNMKNPQSQSPKIKNQQNQLFNQNQSENQNLESVFYSVQVQQKPQNFKPNSQSNIFKSQSFLDQKNQNLNYRESQINNQYPQNRIQQSTIILSPNKCIQQIQINKSLDFQQSYISNQPFNNKSINNSQPFYQETSNKQHWNYNIIDEENNNKIYNSQQFYQHNYQPNDNIQNNFYETSQLKKSNKTFDSFNSSQVLTEYQSCQDDLQSKAHTKQVKCEYCKNDINIQYFLLKCQHFYCQDCLKELLKNQSKVCYVYRCNCKKEIKLQLLFEKKDKQVETLKEKMLINQINALRVNLEQKQQYQLKNCRNKHCSFFTIIQKDLDQKYFYCPQCLDKQSDNSLNK